MFGWEQQVLVQHKGNVFLSADLLWNNSWFDELNRNMEKARWGRAFCWFMYVFRWASHLEMELMTSSLGPTETNSFSKILKFRAVIFNNIMKINGIYKVEEKLKSGRTKLSHPRLISFEIILANAWFNLFSWFHQIRF